MKYYELVITVVNKLVFGMIIMGESVNGRKNLMEKLKDSF
ncbi:hypothetical protein STRDD10_00961 [Streptococcus sp. DD10]|nr:hypothetical protein STRDD10_00961 [Streptococcus sp. DD10]